ncbi:MAG: hypothetical protein PHC86_05220 [Eubacteriales bacterium]|nr:hypothetical protein [Eubacteriales bacterium]
MDDYTPTKASPRTRLVRRATVIFFSGMAALTLFSNTIVNYSLPRVQVKNFESGIISRQIQTDGTVAASLQHTINFGAARTVEKVNVEVGSPVLVGDVLATLKATDGLELLEMEKAYENAQIDLARMKETAATTSVPAAEKAIQAAEKAIAVALKTITRNEEAIVDAKEALDTAWDDLKQAAEDAEDDLNDAQDLQEEKEDLLVAAQLALDTTTETPGTTAYIALQDAVTAAELALEDAQDSVDSFEKILADAKKARDRGPTSFEDSVVLAEEALVAAKEAHIETVAALAQAQLDLTAAKKTDAQTAKDRTREITKAENNLTIQKKKLDQFKSTQDVTEIKADYAGRISKLTLSAGGVINPAEAIVTIDAADAKYELRATLPIEQAKVLVIGDRADVMMGNMGWAQAVLREVREDKDQPGIVKQLIFDIDGEVTLGQQVTLSIYKMSRQYDIIVPNAAVRQDANGSFILVMKQKNGPLGSRFTLERVSATVLESDSTRAAVSATIDYGTPLVTAANKPVEAGSRVLPTK